MSSLLERMSVRKYQGTKVETEKIRRILRAAMQAPSAHNQQPWEFYVTEDPGRISALSEVSPYAGCVKGAPAVIIAAKRKECPVPAYVDIDMSACMENIWLAAVEEGLGGVWIGIAPIEERMDAVGRIAGIPEDQRAFALFPLGYSAESRKQKDRFDESRIHWIDG